MDASQMTLPSFNTSFGSIRIAQDHPEYPQKVEIVHRESTENPNLDKILVQVISKDPKIGTITLTFIIGKEEKEFIYSWRHWTGSYLVVEGTNRKHYPLK